jgi:sugar lactone lactonase YvrE
LVLGGGSGAADAFSNFNHASNEEGTGTTIMQVNPSTDAVTQFAGISDPNCPGGVGLGPNGTLYVADTLNSGTVLTWLRSCYRPLTRPPALSRRAVAGRRWG